MNILIPHSWLKDFLETKANPQKIAGCLSLCSASVEKLNKVGHDWVYEIEITTNRVDMMSIVGIAREAAAVLPQFGIKAKLKNNPYKISQQFNSLTMKQLNNKLEVIIKDKILCPRFSAVVLENIQIKPSPKIIQERLEKSAIRSINNIVDISNYLMRAFGQPVHIFDCDKIGGRRIILRRSRPGEKITTLDSKTFKLPGKDIVIEDGQGRLIDLCGIMGGQNSAVTDKTRNILIFAQTYNPVNIRQTSMRLGQRTEAAQLFEKGTDPQLVMPVLIKGLELIGKLAGGKIASKVYDLYSQTYKPQSIKMSLPFIEQRMGIKIQPARIFKILTALGFQLKQSTINNQQLTIYIPSWRANDIKIPQDIVEEVARVWGYHNLPSSLPAGPLPPAPPSKNFQIETKVKHCLKGYGLTEVYTYSLVGQTLLEKFGLNPQNHLKLKNPLNADWSYLRTTLIPGLLEVIQKNQNQNENLKIFELGHNYFPKKNNLPEEKLFLTIIFQGPAYYQLKGVLEVLLKELAIDCRFKPRPELKNGCFREEKSSDLFARETKLGRLGQLRPELAQKFALKSKTYLADLDFENLVKLVSFKKYSPLPKYPAVIEDLTFSFPFNTYYAQVANLIKQVSPLIVKIDLVNQFRNRKTFRLYYQHPEKSLAGGEVAQVRKAIVKTLASKSIQLVGQV